MSKRSLRWGLGAAAVLLLYASASIIYVRWALTKRAACSLPCRDLGLEVAAPGGTEDGTQVFRPACNPLDLKLELHRPRARRNSRYALWYRLTMTNASCYRLPNLNAFEFGKTWEEHRVTAGLGKDGDLVMKVWGPDGKEIPRENFRVESPQTFLYHSDFEAYKRLKPRLNSLSGLDLGPGDSITSLPTMLWPKVLERGVDWKTAEPAGFYNPRPLPKDAETPPEGFTILDAFVFEKPGTYSIQAVYEKRIRAEPILPYADRIPVVLQVPLNLLNRVGVSFEPDPEPLMAHWFLIRAESPKLQFTVAP